MQLDFKSWSKLKLRLKVENFIKEYVSVILLLSAIFTMAVGRILANTEPAVHLIVQQPQRSIKLLAQMDFLDYLLYDAYSNHITASECFSITNGYVRNSQNLQSPVGC
jgi:hypothetical protein